VAESVPPEGGMYLYGHMFYVYILESQNGEGHYIGQTNDLEGRIERHNSGYEVSTKSGVPWLLVHSEGFLTRAEAMRREKEIKSYKGGKAFKRLIGI
jgi:putative endonuclease